MPNPFSTIGFPLQDQSEFSDLATHLAAEAQRIPVSGGAYLLWASPGGEQVWLQVDSDSNLVGMTPHFAGKSQVSVSVRSILRRPGQTFLDGTIRGCMNGDYPIVVDVPNLATHGRLEIPICVDVQVAAFAREVSTFASVACHEHGTSLTGFLPASWDHLGCQSWDHPARLVGGSCVRSLTRHVACSDVEVIGGIQGGRCG